MTFIVDVTSDYSVVTDANSISFEFDLEFRDFCWDAVLRAPVFAEKYYTWELYEQQSMVFTPMADLSHTGPDEGFCG